MKYDLRPLPSRTSDYKNCNYNQINDLIIQARLEVLIKLKKEMTSEDFLKVISNLLEENPTFLHCIPNIEELIDIDLNHTSNK